MLTLLRMLAGKAGWLLLSFLCIVAVLALWNKLPDRFRDWRAEAENTASVSGQLEAGRVRFERAAQAYRQQLDEEIASFQGRSGAELAKAERDLQQRRADAGKRVLGPGAIALAVATGQTDRVTASYRAQFFELPLLERALQVIALRKIDAQVTSLNKSTADYRAKVTQFNALVNRRNRLQRQAREERRYPACRRAPGLPGCGLVRNVGTLDEELARRRPALTAEGTRLRARRAAMEALRDGRARIPDSATIIANATQSYGREAQRLSAQSGDYAWNQGRDALRRYSTTALWILLGAVLLPILLKLFTFLVIAPLAARSRPIILHDGGPPLVAGASGMSVEVGLDPESELLLRNGLQSSATNIQGRDQLLLDWRIAFSCMAAGLVNLQRLRSSQPDHIVVTGADSSHRVALVEVPAGGAVVLQPRALLGVKKPRNARLVISRPWQLHRLISWITMQLRYVVFHGPCTLIVQGRDGVQIEEASRGRMINKRLTLGFDAGLAYGAARSASFLPYLRGQASLFNDRFEGRGRYLYEQRAAGLGKGSLWGRGLKGIGDGVLSALGI